MREILEEELPGRRRSRRRAEVLPEIFEHERFSTTVANAVLSPLICGYVSRLQDRLGEQRLRRRRAAPPLRRRRDDAEAGASGSPCGWPRPASPPARSPAATSPRSAATRTRSASTWAAPRTDVSLVYDGEERVTKEWFVEYGYPICFPSIEVLTIGAGGGSLAWIDEAGSLRNGPQSAGANPGPGLLRPRQRPADQHRRERRARPARRRADRRRDDARPRAPPSARSRSTSPSRSGSSCVEAADAIIQVANANMADAVRLISIRRGYDPREFCLVAFGGAGPLHGAALARGARRSRPCSCRRTRASPRRSAACSSTSGTTCRRCSSRTPTTVDPAALEAEFAKLEAEAHERLAAEGVPEEQMSLQRLDRHALPRASGAR